MSSANDDDITRLTRAILGVAPEDVARFRAELERNPALAEHRRNSDRRYEKDQRRQLRYPAIKRTIDLVIAIPLLMLLSPLMVLIAVGLSLNAWRSPIRRNRQVGQHGKVFDAFRFQCMHRETVWRRRMKRIEALHKHLGPTFQLSHDPRFSFIGRIVYRLRLTALPSLWNVIRSEMSLVGPPPEFHEVVATLAHDNPQYADRFRVPPGLFGLQSVLVPWGQMPWKRLVDVDLFYVSHASVFMDIKILAAATLLFVRLPRIFVLRLCHLPTVDDVPQIEADDESEDIDIYSRFAAVYSRLSLPDKVEDRR